MITNKLFKNKQTNKHAIQTILVILTFIQKTNYINNITTTVARRRFNRILEHIGHDETLNLRKNNAMFLTLLFIKRPLVKRFMLRQIVKMGSIFLRSVVL